MTTRPLLESAWIVPRTGAWVAGAQASSTERQGKLKGADSKVVSAEQMEISRLRAELAATVLKSINDSSVDKKVRVELVGNDLPEISTSPHISRNDDCMA